MVRAPCCEKMGLKKGPWAPEEDQILTDYIHLYGHGNWRALPKLAGLLRCGKSCRLRWTNYLRPDIKRGNFSPQEEDTIIQLHNLLGNRWSTIAAKLPGRTDNEIKNVWHTHLKKRAMNQTEDQTTTTSTKRRSASQKSKTAARINTDQEPKPPAETLSSPPVTLLRQCSSDDVSTLTTATTGDDNGGDKVDEDLSSSTEEMDESFWSEVLSADNSTAAGPDAELGPGLYDPFLGSEGDGPDAAAALAHSNVDYSSMDFWYNLLTADNKELSELPPI
ncbi:unnamed protein product [Linum tenue]|uniref:Uncharacterized protein n=1 Tax=Linum tenue TaxID=586396 RepID=A0AAV0LMU6_9ROSI|nr:unnamed protein product [Linum tenue]